MQRERDRRRRRKAREVREGGREDEQTNKQNFDSQDSSKLPILPPSLSVIPRDPPQPRVVPYRDGTCE